MRFDSLSERRTKRSSITGVTKWMTKTLQHLTTTKENKTQYCKYWTGKEKKENCCCWDWLLACVVKLLQSVGFSVCLTGGVTGGTATSCVRTTGTVALPSHRCYTPRIVLTLWHLYLSTVSSTMWHRADGRQRLDSTFLEGCPRCCAFKTSCAVQIGKKIVK